MFSKPTRQETAIKQNIAYNEIYELTRFVIDPQYQTRNFASWILSRVIKSFKRDFQNVKMLISFADPTFGHSGTIYKSSNWLYDGQTDPSYWYYHRRKNKIHHKKSIWNAAKMLNISEQEYANKKHLIKVLGHPKLRYILRLH